jgi:quinol monooxygenase YgiN
MAVTALLELRLKPEVLPEARDLLRDILTGTRAFEGCLGVEVLVDNADPAHITVRESWASLERDAAYRAWRAGEGATALGTVLAAAPVLTLFSTDADI